MERRTTILIIFIFCILFWAIIYYIIGAKLFIGIFAVLGLILITSIISMIVHGVIEAIKKTN